MFKFARNVIRGVIVNMRDYLDGKKFDHSGWLRLTSRNSTPINVDLSIDNGIGFFLEGEVSRCTFLWDDYPDGQHEHFRSKVSSGKGATVAVVLKVSTPEGCVVNTTEDVTDFQVIYYSEVLTAVKSVDYKTYHGNDEWKRFVSNWWRTGAGVL